MLLPKRRFILIGPGRWGSRGEVDLEFVGIFEFLWGRFLSGGILRKIVIKEARNIGKGELERLLSSGVERLMAGQAAFAQAAGVGDCTPENLQNALDEEEDDGIDYVARSFVIEYNCRVFLFDGVFVH